MNILAHRTAMANAPPNSLAGLKFCWRQGIGVVECDVTFTKDKKAVIWQDKDNRYLGNPELRLSELTLEEATRLNRSDCQEKLITPDDIWDFLVVYPAILILFDVKYYADDYRGIIKRIPTCLIDLATQRLVLPAVEKGLAGKIGFVTFRGGKQLLKSVKTSAAGVFTSLITVWPWSDVQSLAGYADAIIVGWSQKKLNHWRLFPKQTMRLVEEAKKNNLKVWGGLAANGSDVEWLARHGFDGVWADDVKMVKKVLQRKSIDGEGKQ